MGTIGASQQQKHCQDVPGDGGQVGRRLAHRRGEGEAGMVEGE
jgi:hypothetical protein